MKVTTEGEKVIDLLWDVIAAKGFEKDTYFEMAARDIRALPKLEGTVHVNIALIVKFMKNYFFAPGDLPRRAAPGRSGRRRVPLGPGAGERALEDPLPGSRTCLRRLGRSRTSPSSGSSSRSSGSMLARATPTEEQAKDVDFLLAVGELFTLVVYAQLVLENARLQPGERSTATASIRSSTSSSATSPATRSTSTASRPRRPPRWRMR